METPLFDRMHKTINKCELSLGLWKQILGLRWSIFGLQWLYLRKRPFSKKYNTLMPILYHKKRTFSQKLCSRVFFPHFSCQTLLCHAYIWSKNVNFVNTTIYCGPKSPKKSLLFPPIFNEINHYPHTHILSKKRPFFQKTSSSKVIFFKFCM